MFFVIVYFSKCITKYNILLIANAGFSLLIFLSLYLYLLNYYYTVLACFIYIYCFSIYLTVMMSVFSYVTYVSVNRWIQIDSSETCLGRLRGLAVACWTTDHYHPCSNLGMGISEGCFTLTSLHYLWRSLDPFSFPCTQAVKHQSSETFHCWNL